MFEKNGEWSWYKISKSKTGFVVSFWSRIQGQVTGVKYLYKFDVYFTPDTDLDTPWNEGMTYGEYLGKTIREQYRSQQEQGKNMGIKCLARGMRVF